MKAVKGFLFVLTGLFILVTLFSLLMPSRIITVRSVDVDGSKAVVMQALNQLPAWKQWHPLLESKEVIFTNSDSGKGSKASWVEGGKTVTLTLTQVLDDGIAFTVDRKGDNTIDNNIIVAPINGTDSLQVEWRAVTKLKWYPWEKFSGIFVSDITGPGYQSALNSLKQYAEQPALTMGN